MVADEIRLSVDRTSNRRSSTGTFGSYFEISYPRLAYSLNANLYDSHRNAVHAFVYAYQRSAPGKDQISVPQRIMTGYFGNRSSRFA